MITRSVAVQPRSGTAAVSVTAAETAAFTA